jgi:hypothetical protein
MTKKDKELAKRIELIKQKHQVRKVIYVKLTDDFDGEELEFFLKRPTSVDFKRFQTEMKDDLDLATKNLAMTMILEGDTSILKGDDYVLYDALINAINEIMQQVSYNVVKM